MRTGAYSWKVKQGDTWVDTFHIVDENETNVDLTGWSFSAQVRTERNVLIATFSSSVDTVNSKVTLTVAAATTASIDAGKYRWQAQWVESSGRKFTFLEGDFVVEQDLNL